MVEKVEALYFIHQFEALSFILLYPLEKLRMCLVPLLAPLFPKLHELKVCRHILIPTALEAKDPSKSSSFIEML